MKIIDRIRDIYRHGFRLIASSAISATGATIAFISFIMVVGGIFLELVNPPENPYQSLITFTVLPGVVIFGLVMMVVGMLRQRYAKDKEEFKPLVVDFGNARHRNIFLFILGTTTTAFVVVTVSLYQGYHYTESPEFCGKLCHSVMKPEYTAYQRGSHARVRCAECHIGAGAPWFVRAKISGLRQVGQVIRGNYQRPIPTPVENLRPARDTCEQCHWPEVFHGKKLLTVQRIGEDGTADDPVLSAVMLSIGGYNKRTQKNIGIHWHISAANKVEYQPVDEKHAKIKRVRVTRADGTKTEYVRNSLPDPVTGTTWHTMDCMDCHNRPAHRFQDPDDTLDELILSGQVDRSVPRIREVALKAIKGDYKTQDEAEASIRTALRDLYNETMKGHTEFNPELTTAAIVKLYRTNVFPEMGIKWNNYVSHLGHRSSPGCFRCHDDKHEASDGKTINQDCDLCHEVIVEEKKASLVDPKIREYFAQPDGSHM